MARKRLYEVEKLTMFDLSKMTSYELREVLAPIRDATAKRVRRIEKGKYESPAVQGLMKTGGLLSVQGKDKATLIREIQRGQAFLSRGTSRIGSTSIFRNGLEEKQIGAKEYTQKYNKTDILFGNKKAPEYSSLSDRKKGRFWNVLHKIRQNGIQLSAEEYDTENQLVRIAVKSNNPTNAFLNSIPAEAKEYVENNSHIEMDKDWVSGKLRKEKLDNYWTEKITAMYSAYIKWKREHPEIN